MKMFPYYKGVKVRKIRPGELEQIEATLLKIKARRADRELKTQKSVSLRS